MLVLTRKVQETITIGDHVQVEILSVRGTTVRLGIRAPKEIAVHRQEIYNKIQLQTMKMAMSEDSNVSVKESNLISL